MLQIIKTFSMAIIKACYSTEIADEKLVLKRSASSVREVHQPVDSPLKRKVTSTDFENKNVE